MTIDEVKQERARLAADLSERIMRFQKQTGCTVKRVNVDHLYNDADTEPARTIVEVEIGVS